MAAEPSITFTMRLPWALKEAIDELATRNRRSRTQEILTILENGVNRPASTGGAPVAGEASQA